jgi:hypothetical protein
MAMFSLMPASRISTTWRQANLSWSNVGALMLAMLIPLDD